jgi:hypothetical protein
LSPKGEFWNRLERALDLSKNVSEPAKNDLGNSPFNIDLYFFFKRSFTTSFYRPPAGLSTFGVITRRSDLTNKNTATPELF